MREIDFYISESSSKKIKNRKKILAGVIIAITIVCFATVFVLVLKTMDKTIKKEPKEKFNQIYDILVNDWYYADDYLDVEEELITRAINGLFIPEKDPYSRHYKEKTYLLEESKGIGISIIEYESYFKIKSVSSTHASNLKVDDIILEIDNVSLENKPLASISTLIEGKNSVSIKVKRGEENIVFNVAIAKYNPITTSFTNIDENISYLKINEFGTQTAGEIKTYLSGAKSNIIIDLRDNPGGYIDSVVDVADLFLGKNKLILETKNKAKQSTKYFTKDEQLYNFNKIVILINNNSASGSEALADALNFHLDEKVILHGKTTYGKGSAQKNLILDDGSVLAYTYALWFGPDGNTINGVGVQQETSYNYSVLFDLPIYNIEFEEKDYGSAIESIQLILNNIGYERQWEYLGYFAQELTNTLKDFQRENNIAESGKVDSLTIRYLLARIDDYKVIDYQNQLNAVVEFINNG